MSVKTKRRFSTVSWSPSFAFKAPRLFHRWSLPSIHNTTQYEVIAQADGEDELQQSTERRPASRQFDGAFSVEESKKKPDKDEEKKVSNSCRLRFKERMMVTALTPQKLGQAGLILAS